MGVYHPHWGGVNNSLLDNKRFIIIIIIIIIMIMIIIIIIIIINMSPASV